MGSYVAQHSCCVKREVFAQQRWPGSLATNIAPNSSCNLVPVFLKAAPWHTGTFTHPQYSVISPFKHVSDKKQGNGAGQGRVELRGFSVDTTFTVLQIRPGDVCRQPQTLPPQPVTERLQHAAGTNTKTHPQLYNHDDGCSGFRHRLFTAVDSY